MQETLSLKLIVYAISLIVLITISMLPTFLEQRRDLKITSTIASVFIFLSLILLDQQWIFLGGLVLAMFLEVFIPRKNYNHDSTEISLSLGLGACGKMLMLPVNFFLLDYLNTYYPMNGGLRLASSSIPILLQLFIYLVITDFKDYWLHALAHRTSGFWSIHKIHHGAAEMNCLHAYREHPIYDIGTSASQLVLAYCLGVSMELYIMLSVILNLIINISNHVNINYPPTDQDFPWWGYIVVTPNFHAWHHTFSCRYDANLANVFSCWDLFFGTFETPWGNPDDWQFGVRQDSYPKSLYGELAEPFNQILARDTSSTNS